jgi:hypothetical protein
MGRCTLRSAKLLALPRLSESWGAIEGLGFLGSSGILAFWEGATCGQPVRPDPIGRLQMFLVDLSDRPVLFTQIFVEEIR